MNNSIKKGTFESVLSFLISPVFAIPILLYNISKRNLVAVNLLIFLLAVIGYIYIPTFSNDKTRYIERYILFETFSFKQFVDFFAVYQKSDIIFDWLLFIFGKLKISFNILFFILNYFTLFSVYYLTNKFTSFNHKIKKKYLVCILLIITQFALQHLYSGIRFTFAAAIFFWAIYYIFLQKKYIPGIICVSLACFIHFSFFYLLGPILLLFFFPKINYYTLFKISLIFLFVPKVLIEVVLNQFNGIGGFDSKIEAYVNEDDFLTKNFSNISNVIVYYSRNLWVYFAYLFLLIKSKKDKNLLLTKLVLVFFIFVNILYALPTVYSRYLIFVKFLFTAYIFFRYSSDRKSKFLNWFLLLYIISFIVDIWVLRFNFIESFINLKNLSIFTIFFNQFTIDDVIPSSIGS